MWIPKISLDLLDLTLQNGMLYIFFSIFPLNILFSRLHLCWSICHSSHVQEYVCKWNCYFLRVYTILISWDSAKLFLKLLYQFIFSSIVEKISYSSSSLLTLMLSDFNFFNLMSLEWNLLSILILIFWLTNEIQLFPLVFCVCDSWLV